MDGAELRGVCVCVLGGELASGCFVCLWVSGYPACPALVVAWSHLSSVLLIVYLPNEGGGTLPHVIDSHVLLPSHWPALGFLAEMFPGGEGGWYFTYLCVFLVILFPLPPSASERIVGNLADTRLRTVVFWRIF